MIIYLVTRVFKSLFTFTCSTYAYTFLTNNNTDNKLYLSVKPCSLGEPILIRGHTLV